MEPATATGAVMGVNQYTMRDLSDRTLFAPCPLPGSAAPRDQDVETSCFSEYMCVRIGASFRCPFAYEWRYGILRGKMGLHIQSQAAA